MAGLVLTSVKWDFAIDDEQKCRIDLKWLI